LNGYLLDTNVLSELLEKIPQPGVAARFRELDPDHAATSVVCVTELRYGAARRDDGGALWTKITRELLPRLRVLPLTLREAVRAGEILADLAARGEPIGLEDVFIAATAQENALTAVTRNLRHFSRIGGLTAESWWG
jgi:tRNA(fMet)-specific endonuclease VapC